jgi:hypothetical protein
MENDQKKSPMHEDPSPDGWAAFERAVDAAVKSGPKHKAAKEQGVSPLPKSKRLRPAQD